MGVLDDILEWSAQRAPWQRDALRRLAVHGSISETDIDELTQVCLASHDVANPDAPIPTAAPFSQEHIPTTSPDAEAVRIITLSNIQGVNALAPGQVVTFAKDGMTIVFGFNGSGKSGYARILRAMCRARQPISILPNAFASGDQPPAAVTVDYSVADAATKSVRWEQGSKPPPELGRVNFFDSHCAAVHVNSVNEVAFTPFGLDILSKLVDASRGLNERIQRLISQTEASRPAQLLEPPIEPGSKVASMVSQLTADSSGEELRSLAESSVSTGERIAYLRTTLGSDPAQRARDLRREADRIAMIRRECAQTLTLTGQESVDAWKFKYDDAMRKRAAANLAANRAFGDQPLAGIGEETWREMWSAARRYSEHVAYPAKAFPHVEGDSVCVLCQQPIAAEAGARLVSFERFIRSDTERLAQTAQNELQNAATDLLRVATGRRRFRAWRRSGAKLDENLRRSLWEVCKQSSDIQHAVKAAVNGDGWSVPTPHTRDPLQSLAELENGLRSSADDAERAASADERVVLRKELAELESQDWLAHHMDVVEAELRRLRRLRNLRAALSDTNTNAITQKTSELADRHVTNAICERMEGELNAMGAGYVRVHLTSAGGQLGQKMLQVSLVDPSAAYKPADILSEGEFKCVALAAFLAELATEDSGSALVFDDPVSSLDYRWRRRIALRLAALASSRQVIVFTHDIAFLNELVRGTEAGHRVHVRRGPLGPGECLDGLPWEAMSVRDRIGHLKNSHQAAAAKFRRDKFDEYEADAKVLYGLLRETWERGVEEVLLNAAVQRFDHAVHTQQIRVLTDIDQKDIEAVDAGMTQSSRFLVGHDTPAAGAEPVPEPDEVWRDIVAVERWVAEVRARRR